MRRFESCCPCHLKAKALQEIAVLFLRYQNDFLAAGCAPWRGSWLQAGLRVRLCGRRAKKSAARRPAGRCAAFLCRRVAGMGEGAALRRKRVSADPGFEGLGVAVDDEFLGEVTGGEEFLAPFVGTDVEVDVGVAAEDDGGAVFLAGGEEFFALFP